MYQIRKRPNILRGITILDYVIIGKGEYVSMVYRGLVERKPRYRGLQAFSLGLD
jgi:hypothetical protein